MSRMNGTRRVVVVGAGIGGLVAAVELAVRGREVLVLERAAAPGGKIGEAEVGGARISTGPMLLTLRDVFEEVFALAGARLDEALALRPIRDLGRHLWPDGRVLDLPAGLRAGMDAVGAFTGSSAEARGYGALLARAKRVFEALDRPFLRAPRPSATGLAMEVGMGRLLSLSPFGLLGDAVASHLRDARLRQAMGRFAAYVGGEPALAPATLLLVAHVEQLGLWRVEGGMLRLVEALAALATARGAALRLGAEVREIRVEGGRAAGVRLEGGEEVAARAVVLNAEPAALSAGLFGREAARAVPVPRRRSLSAVTWAMLAEAEGPLAAQTTLHPDPFARAGPLAAAPLTIFAEDRLEGRAAALERLLIGVGVPARPFAGAAEARLAPLARAGIALRPQAMAVSTPDDFAARFPGSAGALYGVAPEGWASAFERPGTRTALPGLFLAGGGTHPGAGVAMAAISGRLAARAIMGEVR